MYLYGATVDEQNRPYPVHERGPAINIICPEAARQCTRTSRRRMDLDTTAGRRPWK